MPIFGHNKKIWYGSLWKKSMHGLQWKISMYSVVHSETDVVIMSLIDVNFFL